MAVLVEALGGAAAFLTTLAFLPQAWAVLRTRNTQGISLATYALFTTGVAIWEVYGILIASPAIIAGNAVTLALALPILVVKAQNVLARREPA